MRKFSWNSTYCSDSDICNTSEKTRKSHTGSALRHIWVQIYHSYSIKSCSDS